MMFFVRVLPKFIVVSYTLYIEPSDEPNGMLATEGDLPIIRRRLIVTSVTEDFVARDTSVFAFIT